MYFKRRGQWSFEFLSFPLVVDRNNFIKKMMSEKLIFRLKNMEGDI